MAACRLVRRPEVGCPRDPSSVLPPLMCPCSPPRPVRATDPCRASAAQAQDLADLAVVRAAGGGLNHHHHRLRVLRGDGHRAAAQRAAKPRRRRRRRARVLRDDDSERYGHDVPAAARGVPLVEPDQPVPGARGELR